MRYYITILLITGLCFSAYPACVSAQDLLSERIQLGTSDRVLILAPHPDDEVLGCTGIINEAVLRSLPIKIVFLTNGDNNEWSFLVYRKHPVLVPFAVRNMGIIRQREALRAAIVLNVPANDLIFLGYPDFGTMDIWKKHWGAQGPLVSMLTRARAVPYENSFHPRAPYKGEEILGDIKKILKDFKPTKIFLSHPGDHNPDHCSFYLFTRVALWDLENEVQPEIYPYLIHFKDWPLPRGYHPQYPLKGPEFFQNQVTWKQSPLTPSLAALKNTALKMHASQYRSTPKYLASFIRTNEQFGDFSTFTLSPEHPSVLLFSNYRQDTAQDGTLIQGKSYFPGITEEHLELKDGSLVISLGFSRPLAKGAGTYLYFCGWRKDVPFADMPKLHIRLGFTKYSIYDQTRKISIKNVRITKHAKKITITLPLASLGNPEKILTSATSYVSEVPLDWPSWYTIEISPR
ncbi:MAG: PIG-L family deacetylase [Candidatus Omnitrophica bacterium]|nr:PIG-L family deacetylase [Candidatus Omnitrophota bacterium]